MSGRAGLSLALLLCIACADGTAGSSTTPSVPWEVTAFPPLPEVAKDVPEERVLLGNFLFYDPILSVDRETACGTCHSELWGMSDQLPRSFGHGAGLMGGPGRHGPNVLRRNSPTLYNMAFRESFLWDGRAATLEEQALIPLLTENEMNRDPMEAVSELASIPRYVELFAAAFPDDPSVTVANMAAALAAFQRTFVSNRALYDGYLGGDLGALSDDAFEGMFRFAEMGCDGCHTPPLFESETFSDRRVAPIEGVTDHGLEEVTGRSEDRGKFRAVSLRNLAFTAPYFHNGSVWTIEEAVEHELTQSGMPFTAEDVETISVFLDESLRDESDAAVRPHELPSGLLVPVDDPGSR